MSSLDILFISALSTVVLTVVLRSWRHLGWVAAGAYALQLSLVAGDGEVAALQFRFAVLGESMRWSLDGFGRLFAFITLGAALLSAWYSAGGWATKARKDPTVTGRLHIALSVNVLAMLLLLSAGDFLTVFIGWELVSWAGLLLMALGGSASVRAGLRYITYAMTGGMAILAGLVLVDSWAGSLQFIDFIQAVPALSDAEVWTLVLLFGVGFGVKMGLLPFHLWQAAAYALTQGPAAAFLGAIAARTGLFAMVLVLVKFIGLTRLTELQVLTPLFSARDLLLWVSALTIVLPTFTALRQNDARLLLAWHGIGQGGYMLMGLLLSDALGSAGGLLHVFNHATYQAALMMAVFAVVYRTGTANLNELGGLVVRMPLTFLTMLIGIIGLAGLPPMNGFVSKWMVYRALVNEGMPLLFVAAVVGTLGTILSVYKLIHNTFLGQLRLEHGEIREAPWSMTLPMLILCVTVFITGFMPGLALEFVADAQRALGIAVLDYTLGGVESSRGSLDMIWVCSILFAGFGVGALLFYAGGGKARRVHQLDNYAGGHFLTADVRYQYSDNFYAGLMHLIKPWYRGSFQWLERSLVSGVDLASMVAHGFFRQRQPAIWLLLSSVALLAWVVM